MYTISISKNYENTETINYRPVSFIEKPELGISYIPAECYKAIYEPYFRLNLKDSRLIDVRTKKDKYNTYYNAYKMIKMILSIPREGLLAFYYYIKSLDLGIDELKEAVKKMLSREDISILYKEGGFVLKALLENNKIDGISYFPEDMVLFDNNNDIELREFDNYPFALIDYKKLNKNIINKISKLEHLIIYYCKYHNKLDKDILEELEMSIKAFFKVKYKIERISYLEAIDRLCDDIPYFLDISPLFKINPWR